MTQIVAERGSDAWWEMEVADLLPAHLKAGATQTSAGCPVLPTSIYLSGVALRNCGLPHVCWHAEASKLRKGEDTMDVWFDSGSSWAGVLGGDEALNYPADLYLEVSGGGFVACNPAVL